MDNLEEMERFVEKFNLPRMNQEEIETMSNPITYTETKLWLNKKKIGRKQKPRTRWFHRWILSNLSVQFSSVAQSCLTLCDPKNHCMQASLSITNSWSLPKLMSIELIQPSHPLSSPSPLVPNPSQHQGLFQWVSSLHEVAKVLEFQLQHQSFQRIFRTDFL